MYQTLPKIKGTYTANFPLAPLTTVKIGGVADVFAQFENIDDFQHFIQNKSSDTSFMILGEGSNVLIRDGGIAGVVTRLDFVNDVQVKHTEIYAGAGATCGKVARAARAAGLTGLEFYAGIPGSVGGALFMNAGAYGDETVDTLKSVDVMTDTGDIKTLLPKDLAYRYRGCNLPTGWIFLGATFALQTGDVDAIKNKMRAVNRNRSTAQPLNLPSSGSWFKNAVVDGELVNAWKITDAAGCRGWQEGDAQVSDKHCNFFVNLGRATAAEMDALSTRVEAEILRTQGIVIEREVKFIGRP